LCDIDCPKQKALSEGRSGDPINVKILHKDGSLSFIPGRGLFLPAPPQAKGDRKGPGEPLAAIMIRDEGDQRKLRETLMEQGRRDPLTGLFHRQYFEEIYGIEVKRAKRHGGTMTLLMLDIRGLKEINQRHGTKAGDGVLREIGQMILACVREIDIAARFGGDEFVILLHGVDEARAKIFTRRLRQKLDGLNQSEVLPERVVLNLALEVTDGEYDRILDRVMGVLDQHRGEPL
jgi:diguanylate cyclase (GGDEF)-like protein